MSLLTCFLKCFFLLKFWASGFCWHPLYSADLTQLSKVYFDSRFVAGMRPSVDFLRAKAPFDFGWFWSVSWNHFKSKRKKIKTEKKWSREQKMGRLMSMDTIFSILFFNHGQSEQVIRSEKNCPICHKHETHPETEMHVCVCVCVCLLVCVC